MLPLRAGGLDASVQQLEQRSFNAWPGVRSAVMGDWLLRSSGGYTKRANSANALQPGAMLDAAALQAIEAWYAAQQLPCIFRLSPLADAAVDGLLAQHGYAWVEASRMLQLRIPVAEAGSAGGAGLQWLAGQGQPALSLPLSFQVQPQCSDVWMQGCCRANGIAQAQQHWHQRIVDGIAAPCAYATLAQDGQAVAWGLAVLERGAVGLYDVVVAPEHRGQGLGRALVQGLVRWAAAQGALRVDLQVRGGNTVAEQLYASLGFVPAYGYHYRVQR